MFKFISHRHYNFGFKIYSINEYLKTSRVFFFKYCLLPVSFIIYQFTEK